VAAKKPRFETARFHVDTGPASLFERVRFKMSAPARLRVDPGHAKVRVIERNAPVERLSDFDPHLWRLMTAEVRTDKGKFVSTAWSVLVDGQNWWVVIGWDGALKTVINADHAKLGLGSTIVVDGPLYEMVERVNRELMDQEGESTARPTATAARLPSVQRTLE
jgi:hypothetical protein